jgi:hypothetical protein
MAVTAAARPIRIGWVVPVAVTVFFLLFGLVVAVETATSFADAQDRRTRVLGEVITADESPAPAAGRP